MQAFVSVYNSCALLSSLRCFHLHLQKYLAVATNVSSSQRQSLMPPKQTQLIHLDALQLRLSSKHSWKFLDSSKTFCMHSTGVCTWVVLLMLGLCHNNWPKMLQVCGHKFSFTDKGNGKEVAWPAKSLYMYVQWPVRISFGLRRCSSKTYNVSNGRLMWICWTL